MRFYRAIAFLFIVISGIFLSACTVPSSPSGTSTSSLNSTPPSITPTIAPIIKAGTSPESTTYLIDGESIIPAEKRTQESFSGSSTITTTELFGAPTMGDLTGDGKPDAAVILIQSPGDSKTFFYIAAAIAQDDGTFVGTNAVLVGDRISPQTTNITNQTIVFNYATKPEGAPETAQNSLAQTGYYRLEDKILKAVPAPKL